MRIGNIKKFTPSGGENTFASGLSNSDGLVFDSPGDLFVANQGNGTITYRKTQKIETRTL
jgi:glucose/arabinose dehydrogenase